MLGGEVIERKHRVSIFRQALDCLVVLRFVFFGEEVDRHFGRSSVWRQVDLAQVLLHIGLHRQCDFVQDICGFVHPAALMSRGGEDFVERLPEAERAVTNGYFRGDLQPTAFSLDEQFVPALRALANANLEADEFLLAFRRCADQHQHAFAVVFHASLQEDAVRPHVHVPARRQIALLPALVLPLPLRRQSADHRRRKIRRILAQKCPQRFLEVACRDAPQVEHRQKGVQALRAPCPQRQDRRREANPLAITAYRAIPNLHPGDLDSANPCLDRPHRAMAVPHQAVATVGKLQAFHRGEKRLGFHLHSLRKQLPRTRAQDIRQWIVDLVRLTQRDNVAILIHGVSLSSRGSGWLDTRLARHPPQYAAYLTPSSPSFPHSSCALGATLPKPLRDYGRSLWQLDCKATLT